MMNIDELKDAWSQDEPKGMNLPLSTEMLGQTKSVLGGLRKKMKAELISLLICYALIIVVLFEGVKSPLFFNITSILLFSLLVINVFYYFRFYVFYKSIGRYDLNIAKSISKIVYELELNAEIYKTYSFSAIPLSILTSLTLIGSKLTFDHLPGFLTANGFISLTAMLVIFAVILISFAVTHVFINLHVRLSYGKYLDELKRVMNDLSEDA
jgi:hypothetical protein